MSVLTRALYRLRGTERRDAGVYGASFMAPGLAGYSQINSRFAENLSAVSGCVGAVASTMASLPVSVFRAQAGGRIEAPEHAVSRLLRAPNSWQTWPDFCEFLLSQVLLNGNAIAVIEHDNAGRPTALVPIPWWNVQVFLLPNGRLAYDVIRYTAPWGGTGTPRRFLDGEVLHLKDRSDDGLLGRSRISRAPEVLGAALGIQSFSAAIWRNAATPAGILKHPAKLSDQAATRLRQDWQDLYGGAGNAHRTAILEEGLDWTPISVSPEDAEVLSSRRFTVEELCRLFQVPPPIVQDYSHNTFTNSSQASLWFAQLTLTPWARKIEAEFARTVFGEDSEFHIEIDLSGLMRGDFQARWESYAIALSNNVLTVDEVRAAEGFGPRPREADMVPPPAPAGEE